MSLQDWIKQIIHPILNKPINEYNITCPLHFLSYIRFKEILIENGYVYISSEDIYVNRDSMEFVYIDLSESKKNYLLEVHTTLSLDKFESLYEKALIREFKNKYVLIEGLSCKVSKSLESEDYDDIKETIPDRLTSVLETSLWNYKELCKKYTNYNMSNTLGILIYGAPGVGKTYALRSYLKKLLNQRNFTIVQIYQDCLDYINMSVLLESCKKLFPCILFIEDMDIKYKDRTDSISSLAGGLLETFDGLSRVENVVFIATSNHYDAIEKALLRPGRIDYMIKIDAPSIELKSQALSKYLEKIDFDIPQNIQDYLINNSNTLAELNGEFQHIIRSYISDGTIPKLDEIESMLSQWKDTMSSGAFSSDSRKIGLV